MVVKYRVAVALDDVQDDLEKQEGSEKQDDLEQEDLERQGDLEPEEAEKRAKAMPQQWQPIARLWGSGLLEYQGFDAWTPEEKELWSQGRLRCKWGIGQVSVRLPVRDCASLAAITYGFLPFVIPLWWAIWALGTCIIHGRPRSFPLFGFCIALGFALVNEFVTKPLCKKTMDVKITNRPPESVCKKPGMPSGHVMNAYTLMFWLLLEVAFDRVVYPEWLLVVLLVMGPVPWARVHNLDHTHLQVAVSASCAMVMGLLAFRLRRTCFPDLAEPWEWYHASHGFVNPFS